VSELLPCSSHNLRDNGRVSLDSKECIRWKANLRLLVVLVDPDLDDGEKRTSLPLTLLYAPPHLCPDLERQV